MPITLLGVLHSRVGDDWSTSMVEGPWMAGGDGVRRLATLAMLADIGTSMPALIHRPTPDLAPVTASLAIDFAAAAADAIGPFRAEAELIEATAESGLARGEVLDRAGDVIATVSISVRYVPIPAGLDTLDETFPFRAEEDLHIGEVLRIDYELGAKGEPGVANGSLEVAPWLCSPRGTMHGGMIPIAADDLAIRLLGGAALWRASTIWVNYIRPSMAGITVSLRARLVHHGRNRAIVAVDGVREDGALLWTVQLCYDRAESTR